MSNYFEPNDVNFVAKTLSNQAAEKDAKVHSLDGPVANSTSGQVKPAEAKDVSFAKLVASAPSLPRTKTGFLQKPKIRQSLSLSGVNNTTGKGIEKNQEPVDLVASRDPQPNSKAVTLRKKKKNQTAPLISIPE